jgi:hypothetical protein
MNTYFVGINVSMFIILVCVIIIIVYGSLLGNRRVKQQQAERDALPLVHAMKTDTDYLIIVISLAVFIIPLLSNIKNITTSVYDFTTWWYRAIRDRTFDPKDWDMFKSRIVEMRNQTLCARAQTNKLCPKQFFKLMHQYEKMKLRFTPQDLSHALTEMTEA